MPTTLTITAKGQITLKKELLTAMGVGPGDKVVAELSPLGWLNLRPIEKTGDISRFIGSLAGKTSDHLTIEEMNDIIADGWAGLL